MYTVNTLDGVKRCAVYGKSKKEVRLKLTETIADRDKGVVFDSGNLSVGGFTTHLHTVGMRLCVIRQLGQTHELSTRIVKEIEASQALLPNLKSRVAIQTSTST
jgi:hypothetical protein